MRLPEKEVIGVPECPILHRWTLYDGGDRGLKLMVHHFLPESRDRDMHDHPRPFITFILRGSYDDLVRCWWCKGTGRKALRPPSVLMVPCGTCDGEGVIFGTRMRPGMIRRRRALHAHKTIAGSRGAWTIVLMGPLRRRWGFWRDGRWWFWREYEERFGHGMRCD